MIDTVHLSGSDGSSLATDQTGSWPLNASKFAPAERISGIPESIFEKLYQIALKDDPVDLSSGFPDLPPPEIVAGPLRQAVAQGGDPLIHQYTRSAGHPRLVRALAKLYGGLIDREINPDTEVLVTIGATEALYVTFMGLINPGDEVILIEPFYSPYESMIRIAGGVVAYVPLKPRSTHGPQTSADWILDPEELASKFNPKTKLIVVNNPQNPNGKVYSKHELSVIADLCLKYDVVAVMDEVYEWIVFDGKEHIRMNTLPYMWERTITIGSAGKALSVTGYKTGWAYGPADLLKPLTKVHIYDVESCPTPLQEAIAVAIETETSKLGQDGSYWRRLVEQLTQKRDRICKSLRAAGLNPVVPDATYYIVANQSRLAENADLSEFTGTHDLKFAKWLSRRHGLLGTPISSFFSEGSRSVARDQIRFVFFKRDSTLSAAEAILKRLPSSSDP